MHLTHVWGRDCHWHWKWLSDVAWAAMPRVTKVAILACSGGIMILPVLPVAPGIRENIPAMPDHIPMEREKATPLLWPPDMAYHPPEHADIRPAVDIRPDVEFSPLNVIPPLLQLANAPPTDRPTIAPPISSQPPLVVIPPPVVVPISPPDVPPVTVGPPDKPPTRAPEPGTLALLLVGLAGIAVGRRG